jgi:hypothetical protein
LLGRRTIRTEPEPESDIESDPEIETTRQPTELTETSIDALLGLQPLTSETDSDDEMTSFAPPSFGQTNPMTAPATTLVAPAKPTELKLNQPKPFTGKRDEVDDFLQDISLYPDINDQIYDTDKKKIAYALTFMNEGDAKSWKAAFLRNAKQPTGLNLNTWAKFQTDVEKAFAPYDALEELTNLKMGTNAIDDHIARYKTLLARSGVPDTSPSAIDYFRKTLNVPLQRKLLELPTPPKDLAEWYEWAARLDSMESIFTCMSHDW